ncbi:type III secretion apparatus protein OrgA/MxiK [Dryocola sp. BD626]|uniref:type III secretion apparatus protein OrgA/MxiK n=1 Tax=Dryocola sp. BD626 TaxID=3133273 RepID=UPI003F4F68D3
MNNASWEERAKRVLFDPLFYLHPQRMPIPARLTNTLQARGAVNDLLIDVYQLSVDAIDTDSDPLTRQWLTHWTRFPQVAYLLGCQMLRGELVRHGALLALPAWARGFLSVNLTQSESVQIDTFSHAVPLNLGFSCLQPWSNRLPAPLAQRFPLLFPSGVDDVNARAPADSLILTLALQHAQKYPNSPPVASA